MTSRDRIVSALDFRPTDRIPRDLGGMRSTGISAFAYPKLVAALGLPPRAPRVYDTGQMLALPDSDVLDALGCDVVTVEWGVTNAFDQPELWHDYGFNGRLAAKVRNPAEYSVRTDGTIVQSGGNYMPPSSFVFNSEHSGQPMPDFDAPLPLIDLKEFARKTGSSVPADAAIREARDFYHRVRESTGRAVFSTDYFGTGIGIGGYAGLAIFPMICVEEPDFVREYHEIITRRAVRNVQAFLPAVRESVDIVMTGCDDWGTQNTTIASPKVYRDLFLPFYRRVNDEVHRIAPGVKTFLHCCGAVYGILDSLVESGFDIINPVQWPAGGHSYREWKDRVRGRATLWGGGVDSQHTLARGTVEDVAREAREVCAYLKKDGGFVFCNIHNLLAEVPADKILALYRAAGAS
jgi:uroporphyrinogen decarboxylase